MNPSDSRRLSQRAVAVLAVRGGSMAATLGASVLLARVLGVEAFGSYSYAVAIAAVASLPLTSGTPQLITRLVATYDVSSERSLMAGLLRRARQAAGLGGLGLAGATAAIVWLLGDAANLLPHQTFLLATLLVPLNALVAVQSSALTGFGRVIAGQVIRLMVRPLTLLCLSAVVFWQLGFLDSTLAIGLRAAGAATALVCASLWLRGLGRRPEVTARFRHRNWLRSAAPLALLGGLQVITSSADQLMLGLLSGPVAVGLYAPASQGAGLVVVVLSVLNSTVAPNVVRLHRKGDLGGLQKLATWTARRSLLAGSLPALALALAGGPALAAVYGIEFVDAAPALAVLALAQLVNAGLGSVGLLLNMTGHERDSAKGVFVAALTNIVLNLALIPSLGPTGAALATAVSLVIWNVLLARSVRRRLGIDSSFLGAAPKGPTR